MQSDYISFLFDDFDSDCTPLNNATTSRHKSFLYSDFLKDRSNYKIKKTLEFELSTLAVYVVELIWADISKLFDFVDSEVLNFLIKNKIPILFYFPSEGFCVQEEGWCKIFERQFKKYNLQGNSKYLITGNLNSRQFSIFEKTYGISYFELVFYRANLGKIDFENYLDNFNGKRRFDFLSLNAQSRTGRVALTTEILRKNLEENALFSWLEDPIFSTTFNEAELYKLLSTDSKHYYEKNIKNKFTSFILDVTNDKKQTIINAINWMQYQNSYFSLVSETEISSKCLFITEKTFKPIYAGHPFIIWGSPGVLQYLNSIGYRSFATMFDESYDNETNPAKRLKMILKEVEKFTRLSIKDKKTLLASQKNILKHNHINLVNRCKIQYAESLTKIIKGIKNDIEKNKDKSRY